MNGRCQRRLGMGNPSFQYTCVGLGMTTKTSTLTMFLALWVAAAGFWLLRGAVQEEKVFEEVTSGADGAHQHYGQLTASAAEPRRRPSAAGGLAASSSGSSAAKAHGGEQLCSDSMADAPGSWQLSRRPIVRQPVYDQLSIQNNCHEPPWFATREHQVRQNGILTAYAVIVVSV